MNWPDRRIFALIIGSVAMVCLGIAAHLYTHPSPPQVSATPEVISVPAETKHAEVAIKPPDISIKPSPPPQQTLQPEGLEGCTLLQPSKERDGNVIRWSVTIPAGQTGCVDTGVALVAMTEVSVETIPTNTPSIEARFVWGLYNGTRPWEPIEEKYQDTPTFYLGRGFSQFVPREMAMQGVVPVSLGARILIPDPSTLTVAGPVTVILHDHLKNQM